MVSGRTNPDAKSALIGRLLLRFVVHKALGIPYSEIQFSRTKEGKPFLVNPSNKFPNFNFNISHQAEWVVLASEPHDIIGIDVMETVAVNLKTDEDKFSFLQDLEEQFTAFEWKNIRFTSNVDVQIKQFYRHWTLKEGQFLKFHWKPAYIKAVGIGLGFPLQDAEFTMNSNEDARDVSIYVIIDILGNRSNQRKRAAKLVFRNRAYRFQARREYVERSSQWRHRKF